MLTQNNVIGRMTARPAVFALLVLVTGAITGLVLYSKAGLFSLTYGFVLARTPNSFYGLPLRDKEWAAQMAKPGVTPGISGQLEFIDPTPDTGQLIWQALTTFPSFVVAAVSFFLLWRLVWRARGGVYIPQVARQVRFLGWWLIAGGVLAPQIERFAMTRLLDTVAVDDSNGFLPADISLVVLAAGLGLLVLSSVLRDGVRMRDDLEGTV